VKFSTSRPLALAVLVLAACRTPPPAPLEAPMGGIAGWIPKDVVMVLVARDGGDAIDTLAVAMHAPSPRRHVAPPEPVASAWARAGVAARGIAWMLIDGDAATTVRCARIERGNPAAALVAAGGIRSKAGDAVLVQIDDVTVVLRGAIACSVTSAVTSRRALAAARLATLAGDDRLFARDEPRVAVERALAAVPEAQVIVWGAGAVIGGGIDASGRGLAGALGELGEVAIALESAQGNDMRIAVVAPRIAAAPPVTVQPGAYAGLPTMTPLAPLPLPAKDLNPDVPESREYKDAVSRLARVLAEAVDVAAQIDARRNAGLEAWVAAWGTAMVAREAGRLELTWRISASPVDLRAAAERAFNASLAGVDALQVRYSALIRDGAALNEEILRIRARDVAAFDRGRP